MSQQELTIKEVEIAKLRLRPGDVLVVRLPNDTRHSWMQRLAMHLHKVLPRNPTLIICNDKVQMEIMTQEEADKLKEEVKNG